MISLRVAVGRMKRGRWRIVRAALRVDHDNGGLLERRLRDTRPSVWLAGQVDGLLRRGDRLAAEVERECEAQLGPLLQGLTNPASCWRGATGRLRGIAPGKTGFVARRTELEQEAITCGYNEPIYKSRSGRRVLLGRTGPAPAHHLLHGAIASAAVALWDLRVVRRRLRAGWPAGRALSSLIGLARGKR